MGQAGDQLRHILFYTVPFSIGIGVLSLLSSFPCVSTSQGLFVSLLKVFVGRTMTFIIPFSAIALIPLIIQVDICHER